MSAAVPAAPRTAPPPAPRRPARIWQRWLVRLAVLSIVPLVLLGPALVRGRLFLSQAPAMFEPLASEQPEARASAERTAHWWTGDRLFPALVDQRDIAERWRAGEGAGWRSDLSLGLPLLGNALNGPYYPPNLLALVVPPERAALPLAFLALVLAGLGTWRFLERRGLAPRAAAVGAVGMQAAGFGVLNLHYGMKVDAVLWLPFCLAAIDDIARGRRRAGVTLMLCAALPFTTGFPQIAVYVWAAAFAYAWTFLGPWRRKFGEQREPARGARPTAIAMLLLAPLVAAPAVLPMWQASSESLRVDKTAAAVAQEALPGVHALGLFAPHLWGRPDDPRPGNRQPLVWWLTPSDQWTKAENASPLEWDPWTGAALLVLAVVGLLRGGQRARFPALLVLLSFAFAQGWPIVRLAYHLPGFGAGAPARALAIAWVGWAWLGALGAQALMDRRPGSRRIAYSLAIGLAATAAILASAIDRDTVGAGLEKSLAARYGRPVEEARTFFGEAATTQAAENLDRALVDSLLLLVVFAVMLFVGSIGRSGPIRRLPIALLFAFVADALLIGFDHTRGLATPRGTPLFPPSPTIEAVREAAGGARVWRIDHSAPGLDETIRLARPNMLPVYGVRDVSAYVAFTPRRSVELFQALHPDTRVRSGIGSLPSDERIDHPILDRADVGVVLAVEPLSHPSLELVHSQPGFHVHRRATALGPAHVARQAEVRTETISRLARLLDPAVDPREIVIIEEEPPAGLVQIPADAAFTPAVLHVTRPAGDRIRVRADGGTGGWLVVHEAWSRGWRATIDGEAVRPLAADHAFLAVPLPPGGATVEFRFASQAVRGAWISALALLVGAVLSRRPRPVP